MAENYVIRTGQPGAANKPSTALQPRVLAKNNGEYPESYIARRGGIPSVTMGGSPLSATNSIVMPNGSIQSPGGVYTSSVFSDSSGNLPVNFTVANDPQNIMLGINSGRQPTIVNGDGVRSAQYISGLISEDEYISIQGSNASSNSLPGWTGRYTWASPVGRVLASIPTPLRGTSSQKGKLISYDQNGPWWNSLNNYERTAIIIHNEEVISAYGGNINLAYSAGQVTAAPGSSGINPGTHWVEVGGNSTTTSTTPTGSDSTKTSTTVVNGKTSVFIPNGGSNSQPLMVTPGVDASTGNETGGTSSSGGTESTTAFPVDPRAQFAAQGAGVNINGTPKLNSWGLSALQTNNILSDTDAVTRFLMQRNGSYSPSLGSQLSGPMSAMPMMYLLDNAGALSFDPNSLDATSAQSLTSGLLSQVLSGDGSLNYANNFMQNQTQGSGIDPVAALQKLFMVGDPTQSNNVLTEFLGSGNQNTQIETTKNFITASLANANPYIAGVLATLVDSLGTQYLASGGSPNGFLDWLAKNSFFGNFTVAK